MTIEILYPVETETELLEVLIEAEVSEDNYGIGLHDFHGLNSFDCGENFVMVEEIKFDVHLYNFEQRIAINEALKTKHCEDAILKKYFNSFDI